MQSDHMLHACYMLHVTCYVGPDNTLTSPPHICGVMRRGKKQGSVVLCRQHSTVLYCTVLLVPRLGTSAQHVCYNTITNSPSETLIYTSQRRQIDIKHRRHSKPSLLCNCHKIKYHENTSHTFLASQFPIRSVSGWSHSKWDTGPSGRRQIIEGV